MMDFDISFEKRKPLKHVKVYNKLFELIQNGTFPPGSQLPSEPDLATQMDVSRMTLRKALALLQEDALIRNMRGKGNFVTQSEHTRQAEGMETMQHPVHTCCTEHLDKVEMEFRIEPPTNSITQSLGQKSAAVVIADRWYKHNEIPCAYSLSFLPIELIAEELLDLNDSQALLEYLERGIYAKANYSSNLFCHSTAGNFTAAQYTLSEHESFLLIVETIYGKDHRILVSNKHYIPVDLFKVEIVSYRDGFRRE